MWKGKNEGKGSDVGDEEGVNVGKKEGEMSKNDAELIKKAVLDVRNEACDENLVKLFYPFQKNATK